MEYKESVAALPEGDIVSQLLRKSFAARNVSEQKVIVNQKPTPKLVLKTKDRSFQEVWYSKKDWLCGSEGMKCLFCWPCLLFRPRRASQTWAETGYKNMHAILCDCQKHERAKSHMQAYKMWKTFDMLERVDVLFSRARRDDIEQHNEEVRQNREMLKTLSEGVIYLAKQELPFRGHDESSSSLNKGNYRELLECLAKFDSVFEYHLHGRPAASERAPGGGVLTGVSADIQNDLIEYIDMIFQDQFSDLL